MRVTPGRAVDTIIAIAALITIWRLAPFGEWLRAEAPPILPGRPFQVPGVNWRGGVSTLVVSLEPSCPVCQDNIELYRKLIGSAQAETHADVLIVSGRAPTAEMQAWIGIDHPSVQYALVSALGDTGFFVTPAVVVVGPDGLVRDVAHGLLDAPNRDHLLDRLRGAVAEPLVFAPLEVPVETCEQMAAAADTILIDVRTPEEFSTDHHARAINIPAENLGLRARFDLDAATRMLIASEGHIGRRRSAGLTLLHEGWREVYVCTS